MRTHKRVLNIIILFFIEILNSYYKHIRLNSLEGMYHYCK